MLDPGLEQLHRHGRLARVRLRIGWSLRQGSFDVPLVMIAAALAAFSPAGTWAPAWVVVTLVAAFALASVVRFETGAISTSPVQLIVVPLWFAVPPGALVPCIAAGMICGGVIERLREGGDEPVWHRIHAASDAWTGVGPAVVLALAGAPAAAPDVLPVAAAAFAAQVAVDSAKSTLFTRLVYGVAARTQLRLLGWIAAIDASLAPVGFLVAIVMVREPAALLAVIPLIAITGEFARERAERIEQALQLSSAYRGTAQLMGDVLEADDAYTGGEHTQGVVDMAVAVGLELGLGASSMRDLEFGALLHDIGKLRVPNEIINKPGPLSDDEWIVVREHPRYGQEMLDRVGGVLREAGLIVRAHHERWDGRGYPDGLAGEAIPLEARIITVCDSFSAMTTRRSYSAAKSPNEGIAELRRCSGTQFDPAVVRALCVVVDRVQESGSVVGASDGLVAVPVAAALGLRPIA